MSQAAKASKDVEKSRRSPETEHARKKQKMEPVTFSDSNSLVTFIVGKEGATAKFTAHKEVVCHHSEVLNAAFNSDFVEGQTQTYRLEDTTEATFNLFMQWIYFQKIVVLQLQNEYSEHEAEAEEEEEEEDMALAGLWILADRLCMPCLQNAALKAIFDISEESNRVETSTMKYIYDNTASDSSLRQFAVANCATMNSCAFGELPDNYPQQFFVDFGSFMLRKVKGDEKQVLEISDYFVKED